jgi:hypothetical protein
MKPEKFADRLKALSQDAAEEGESIRPASLAQFLDFFQTHADLGIPKITLTPDGTLRIRWLYDRGDFFAVEFTGRATAKIAAEISGTAAQKVSHFTTTPLGNIVSFAKDIGVRFA